MTNMPLLSYCKSMKSLSQNRKKVKRERHERHMEEMEIKRKAGREREGDRERQTEGRDRRAVCE